MNTKIKDAYRALLTVGEYGGRGFVTASWRPQLSGSVAFLLLPLSQPDTRSAAVLVDDLVLS